MENHSTVQAKIMDKQESRNTGIASTKRDKLLEKSLKIAIRKTNLVLLALICLGSKLLKGSSELLSVAASFYEMGFTQ